MLFQMAKLTRQGDKRTIGNDLGYNIDVQA